MQNSRQRKSITIDLLKIRIGIKSFNKKELEGKEARLSLYDNTLKPQEIQSTELQIFSAGIVFKTELEIKYQFNLIQRFSIRAIDKDGVKLCEGPVSPASLISSSTDEAMIFDLYLNRNECMALEVKLIGKEISQSSYTLEMSARNLKNVEWRGMIDPFIRVCRPPDDYLSVKKPELMTGSWFIAGETERQDDTQNPDFNPIIISTQKLCLGRLKALLKFEVWDYEESGIHVFVGSAFSPFDDLLTGKKKELQLLNPNSKPQECGKIIFNKIQNNRIYKMVDYIRAGLNISSVVCIDFTGSNGDHKDPSSLHYIDPERLVKNPYISVIEKVGEIIVGYDKDKLVPVYGFGARSVHFKNPKRVSHCFPINFNYENPNCNNVQGILEAYYNCLEEIDMLGPSCFEGCLQKVIAEIKDIKIEKMNYTIILIITDGQIVDLDSTFEILEQAQQLPISIVIIGVGDDDFSQMEELDSDGKQGRDIVQFVKFKDFENDLDGLAKEVLEEIPDQLTSFYLNRNIIPGGSIST